MPRRILSLVVLAVLFLGAGSAYAGSRPDRGEYMLVTPILDGVEAGKIVPIYIHLTLDGDRMYFRFMNTFPTGVLMCEMFGKCERTVLGLSLRFAETADGRIVVHEHKMYTGPGFVIDRKDVDIGYIQTPTLRAIDGAEVVWSDRGVTFTSRGRRKTRTARFVRADLRLMEDALAFALSPEIAVGPLEYCITRQIVELANKPAPTRAEADILRAARAFGRAVRLARIPDYYGNYPEKYPGPREILRRITDRNQVFHLALVYPAPDDWDSRDLDAILVPILKRMNDWFVPAYAESVFGHEEDILAARRHLARLGSARLAGFDLAFVICNSVLLEEF